MAHKGESFRSFDHITVGLRHSSFNLTSKLVNIDSPDFKLWNMCSNKMQFKVIYIRKRLTAKIAEEVAII